MKLYSPGASPFVAKAAMVAKHLNITVEFVEANVAVGDPALDAANPLSKIPCLVLDNGFTVYDSRTITRYLNRSAGGNLFPSSDPELLSVERLEALCDGVCDCAVGFAYEKRFRPASFVYEGWLERLWGKVGRGLDALQADLPPNGDDINMGSIALAALLSYLDLRFAGEWEEGRGKLVNWMSDFDAAHPDLSALKPSA